MKYRCRLLYNAQDPTRNIERKNSSPLKIKRVKFVKILSFEFTLVFSPRDKYTPRFLPLPYKSPTWFTQTRARTHTHTQHACTRFFPVQRFLKGERRGKGISKERIPRFEEKLGWTGWKYGILFEGRFFEVFEKGDRGKGAQPFICLGEACRVRAPPAYAYRFDEFHPKFSAGTHPTRFTQYFGNLL